MTTSATLRLGTRGSALARTQTDWVARRLRDAGIDVAIEIITTRGDDRRDVPIASIGGDGVFVRELERALLDGRIDAAVHSLKDLPTADTPGLALACVPSRESAFDALVGRTAATLEALPPGAVVGTSSIRRVVQVQAARSDLVVTPLRGNVDTRLRRLDEGAYDAVILATAGLERLGLAHRITETLRPPAFWPAVAQGALGIQARADDAASHAALGALDDAPSHAAVLAERALLAELAGGCLAPIGGWAHVDDGGRLVLGGCVLDMEPGTGRVRRLVAEDSVRFAAAGVSSSEGARDLGRAVAARLLAAGAEAMLETMRTRLA
jgi:hydroxymethylbilane synthase